MQAHSNQSEQAAAIPAAAELTQRITSTFDNPEAAALVQAQLRAYPPVWDLALDPAVSAALLDAVSAETPAWWQPARLALLALAAWTGLEGEAAVKEWLLGNGATLLSAAGGESEPDELDAALRPFLEHALVRDVCAALYWQTSEAEIEWAGLPAGVLVCLYGLALDDALSIAPAELLVEVAQQRPDVAARMVWANETQERSSELLCQLVDALQPWAGAALIETLQGLGESDLANDAANVLSDRLLADPVENNQEHLAGLADAALTAYYWAVTRSALEPDVEPAELELAWQNSSRLMVDLALRLGQAHLERQNPAAALIPLQMGLQVASENPELRAAVAGAFIDLDQTEQAFIVLGGVSENQASEAYSVAFQRARARTAAGDPEANDAIETAASLARTPGQQVDVARLGQAREQLELACRLYESAVEASPSQQAWIRELAELYAAGQQWNDAELCYRQVVSLDPADNDLRLIWARVLCKTGDFDMALVVASEATNRDPQNVAVMSAWVEVAHAAGRWLTTVHAAESVLALDPDNTAVHIWKGNAHAALNEDEDALYHLHRAVQLAAKEEEVTAWLALADHYELREQWTKQEQCLNEAVHDVGENRAAELIYRQAVLYEQTGRPTEAQAAYWRSYQLGNRSSRLLTRLGKVLSRLGHHEQAIEKLQEGIAQADADGSAYQALALALESAGRPQEAVTAAKQATQLAPADAGVLLDAGRLSLAVAESDEAVALLSRAAELAPEDVNAWRWLGQAHQASGDLPRALDAFSSALRLDPSDPYQHHHLGDVCLQLGQLDMAITSLTEAANKLPEDLQVQESLAKALETAGWWGRASVLRQEIAEASPESAERMVQWARAVRHVGDLTLAADILQRTREMASKNQRALFEQGLLLRDQGDRAGAVGVLTDFVRQCQETDLLWQAGDVLVDLGETDAAAISYGRAVDLDADNSDAQARLGRVSAGMGDYARALAAYQKATELEPENPDYLVAAGKMHTELKDHAAAVSSWKQALALRPEDVGLVKLLAEGYARQGEELAALRMYEKAADLASEKEETTGSIWREAGRHALALGELDKAQRYLSHSVKSSSRDPEVYSLAGALADRLGREEEALGAYRRAAELAPGQRDYQLQLADALTGHGREMDALEVWKELVQEDGSSGETIALLERMAHLYLRAGRFADAERTFRIALEKSPDSAALQRQLAAVLVEQAEQQDFHRRVGFPVENQEDALAQAIEWLAAGDTLTDRRDLARAKLLQGGVNEAISGLKTYLASFGEQAVSDLNAQRALGVAYRRAGLMDSSIKALTTAVSMAAHDVRTAVELVHSYLAAGQHQTAQAFLAWLMSQREDDAVLYYYDALTAVAAGDPERAIVQFDKAASLESSVPRWWLEWAGQLREMQRYDKALIAAEQALTLAQGAQQDSVGGYYAEIARILTEMGRGQEAASYWETALEFDADQGEWWLEYGDLLVEIGQAFEALSCFEVAEQLNSDQDVQPGAALYLGWARALVGAGRLDEAGERLDQAWTIAPDSPAVHAGFGEWQAARGDWQQALTSHQKALLQASGEESTPADERARYHFLVAQAYHELGSPAQAAQELERAAGLHPGSATLYTFLGDLYLELGERDMARQAYQHAAQVGLGNPAVVLKLAQFLQIEGHLDQGLDWLTKALALRPDSDLWLEAARIYERRGERPKQMEALHEAVKLEPEHTPALFELALAYKQRKAYQQSIEMLERVTALEPKNEQAHKQLSAVLAMSLAGRIGRRQK